MFDNFDFWNTLFLKIMAIFVILPLCSLTKYNNFLKTWKILTNFEQHIKNSITELTQFYNRYSLTLDCISPRAFLVILPFVMIIIQQENTQDNACVSIFESRGLFFHFIQMNSYVQVFWTLEEHVVCLWV